MNRLLTWACIGVAVTALGRAPVVIQATAADTGLPADIAPVLTRHCSACHGPDMQEGDLRLDTLGHDFASPQVAARWRDVADQIRAGDMPPEDRPRPADPPHLGPLAGRGQPLHVAPQGRELLAGPAEQHADELEDRTRVDLAVPPVERSKRPR